MDLEKIELHNYRQHRDLTIEFTGHLIAVVGRNGSGKSNFLGAIQFALTGEQPPFNKSDLLSWNTDEGWVKFSFKHAGMRCLVQRRIESAGCTMKIWSGVGEDEKAEEFSGAKKVAEAMKNVLGIDPEILKQSVFVRQTEVESCLFTDPRERELNFQRLLGLQDAAKVNKLLGDIITGLGSPESMDEAISQAQAVIDAKKPEIDELTKIVAVIQEELSRLPKTGDIDEAISERNASINRMTNSIRCAKLVKEHESLFEEAFAKYGAVASEELPDTTNMLLNLQTWQGRLKLAKSLGSAGKAIEAAEAAYDRIFSEGRPCEENKIEDLRKMEVRLKDRRSEIQGELKSLGTLMAACAESNGTTCPLCGSATDHDISAELQGRIDSLDAELSDNEHTFDELHKELVSEEAKCLEYDKRLDIASKNVDRAKSAMDALFEQVDGDIDELDESKITPILDDLRKRLSEANGKANEIQLARERVDSARAQWRSSVAVAEKAGVENVETFDEQKAMEDVKSLKEEIDRLSKQRQDLFQMSTDLAGAKAARDQAVKAVKETEQAIERLRKKQAENDEMRRKIGVLTDVRDWFNYKNGPRVLTRNIMAALTDSVNHYLDKFGSPFTVEASDEGMGFRVRFCDGRAVPDPLPDASMLSGGQKIALAVAFRFAVYTLFSNKLGLLSLDEPTAYLDDETIARFGDLLQKIAQIARNSSLQILMATHEASLAPCFDQTIVIGK
jgi:DNA repair exonuclease SbcCD ATPase subunit